MKKKLQQSRFHVNIAKFLRTSANGCFCSPLEVDYFAIYWTHLTLIHFTLYVNLYRRWAALYIFICHSPLTGDKVRVLWNENQLFLIETMIILSQTDSKKSLLIVFKKSARFACNIFYFAQYFSRNFTEYFPCEIFRKMQLAFPQCTYMDEWLS